MTKKEAKRVIDLFLSGMSPEQAAKTVTKHGTGKLHKKTMEGIKENTSMTKWQKKQLAKQKKLAKEAGIVFKVKPIKPVRIRLPE